MRTSLVVIVCLALGGVASAQTFEEVSRQTTELSGPAGLIALFWSQDSDCNGIGNDLRRRQCEGVRAARRSQARAGSYMVEGSAAISLGEYDDKRKSSPIAVQACVACGKDAPRQVMGSAKLLYSSAKTFKDRAAADAWTSTVLPRLRAQYVVTLPTTAAAKGAAYTVDVLAFRVYDPCDGKVLFSNPRSGDAQPDTKHCPLTTASESTGGTRRAATRPKKQAPVERLPEQLTPAQINTALEPVRRAGQGCFEKFGIQGTAKLKIQFDGAGAIKAVSMLGEFADTPTGQCVLDAVKAVSFPRSHKSLTSVSYPISVR